MTSIEQRQRTARAIEFASELVCVVAFVILITVLLMNR
jgi:hypothetical protein